MSSENITRQGKLIEENRELREENERLRALLNTFQTEETESRCDLTAREELGDGGDTGPQTGMMATQYPTSWSQVGNLEGMASQMNSDQNGFDMGMLENSETICSWWPVSQELAREMGHTRNTT